MAVSAARGPPLLCGHPLPLGRHHGERSRAFLISSLCLHNPSFCQGIFSSLRSPGERARFRLRERYLWSLTETNPAQSCPGTLLRLKGRKSPIPVSLPRMPCWNESGVRGKTAQGRGRVAFAWESRFSPARRSKALGKSHGKKGTHAPMGSVLFPSELCPRKG